MGVEGILPTQWATFWDEKDGNSNDKTCHGCEILPMFQCGAYANNKMYSHSHLKLKGMCHDIFDLHFFHDSNPSGPLINRIKYFPIRFRFRRDI